MATFAVSVKDTGALLSIGEAMGTPLRSAQDVADYLGVPLTTLYQWRTKGTAPRAVKVGRHIRFRQEDVDAWCERNADQPRVGAA